MTAWGYMRPELMQPCAQDGFATLSMCKPQIRKQARCGDVVVAYRVDPQRSNVKLSMKPAISFIGIVYAVLPMDKYMGNRNQVFISRKDNLYSPEGSRVKPTTNYDKKHWRYSGLSEERVIERDWGGKNVLVFKEFVDVSRNVGRVHNQYEFRRIWNRVLEEPHFDAGDKSRRGHRLYRI